MSGIRIENGKGKHFGKNLEKCGSCKTTSGKIGSAGFPQLYFHLQRPKPRAKLLEGKLRQIQDNLKRIFGRETERNR